jgi:hypothetical protein
MSKGMAVLSLLAIVALGTLAMPVQAEPMVRENGRICELVEQLSGKEYVLGSASRDSRPYVDPTPVLHAFRHLAATMAWGDINTAARKAAELGYEVIEFTDVDTQREYYVLRENLAAVQAIRGWGSYIFNPRSKVDAIVEVPHRWLICTRRRSAGRSLRSARPAGCCWRARIERRPTSPIWSTAFFIRSIPPGLARSRRSRRGRSMASPRGSIPSRRGRKWSPATAKGRSRRRSRRLIRRSTSAACRVTSSPNCRPTTTTTSA